MAPNPRAMRAAARHVPWLIVGVLAGVAIGLTIWSPILGDASIGLVVGISTGLLFGVAMVDLAPPAD